MATKTDLQKLYKIDDHLWLEQTIRLIKENRLDLLDLENLIEELEELGRREKHKVVSILRQIVVHLLLLQYWQQEFEYNQNHWRGEIATFRVQLHRLLTTNLKNYLWENLEEIYQEAVFIVSQKTGLELTLFPESCSYQLEQLLDLHWLPE
ncbi:MAG: DUF29 domain-containing protein [Symploca sp. SIO2G7]|nr:DUF29 domain-containing protein [Symploca sp. SIO2G7]